MAHVEALLPEFELPRDELYEYTQSFRADEVNGGAAREFFDRFGLLVVRDALTAEESSATVDEIFQWIYSTSPGFDRDDSSTWGAWNSRSFGMPALESVFSKQFILNRQNENVYNTFRALLGYDELLSNHDRWVLYRPTAGGNGQYRTRPNLHLDMNPWRFAQDDRSLWKRVDAMTYSNLGEFVKENNMVVPSRGPFLQGIVNLLDNHDDDGGFWLVPGFHRVFEQWVDGIGPMVDPECRYTLPSSDPLMKRGVRVTAPAGALIVWDQRILHGSQPNNSERYRCMQPLRMFSKRDIPKKRRQLRATALVREMSKEGITSDDITDIGRIVFDLSYSKAAL